MHENDAGAAIKLRQKIWRDGALDRRYGCLISHDEALFEQVGHFQEVDHKRPPASSYLAFDSLSR